MGPREIVSSLEYLQKAGLPAEQLCRMHHFDRYQSYMRLLGYFSSISYLRSNTNILFGERIAYVTRQHKEGQRDFSQLISEALTKFPLTR